MHYDAHLPSSSVVMYEMSGRSDVSSADDSTNPPSVSVVSPPIACRTDTDTVAFCVDISKLSIAEKVFHYCSLMKNIIMSEVE